MKHLLLATSIYIAIYLLAQTSDFETVIAVCLAWIISKQLINDSE